MTFLCTLATKLAKISSIYSKITKLHPMFRDFSGKTITPCLGIFCEKSPISAAHPRSPLGEYPPPPPPQVYLWNAIVRDHLALTIWHSNFYSYDNVYWLVIDKWCNLKNLGLEDFLWAYPSNLKKSNRKIIIKYMATYLNNLLAH